MYAELVRYWSLQDWSDVRYTDQDKTGFLCIAILYRTGLMLVLICTTDQVLFSILTKGKKRSFCCWLAPVSCWSMQDWVHLLHAGLVRIYSEQVWYSLIKARSVSLLYPWLVWCWSRRLLSIKGSNANLCRARLVLFYAGLVYSVWTCASYTVYI
jgi:hypothetical protein